MNRFTGPLFLLAMLAAPLSAFAGDDWSAGVSSKMNDGLFYGSAHYKFDSSTLQSEYWVHTSAKGKGHKKKKDAMTEAKAEVAEKNEEGQGPIAAERKKKAEEAESGGTIRSSASVVADPADTCRLFPTMPGCQPDIGPPGGQQPGSVGQQ